MVGLINKEDIYDIADAIREKTQTEDTFKPSEMGDLIRSIRVIPENSYQLKEIESTPTSLATFDADALPMPSLKVGIEPVQEGSGDPSPENIRPISGHTKANVSVAGKNLLPTGRGYHFSYDADVGTVLDVDTAVPSWTDDGNGEFSVTLGDWQRCGLLSVQLPIGKTVYVRIKIVSGSPSVTTYTLDADYRIIRKFSNYNPASDGLDYNTQIQLAENEHYVGVAIIGHNKKVIIRNPHIVLNTDESYEPYNGQTYSLTFTDGSNPLTVYGFYVDLISGLLTINKLGINVMSQEKRGWQVGSKSVCYRITLPQTATSCTPNQTHGAISNMMTEQLAYYGVSRPNDLDSINFAIDTSGVALAVYDTDLTLSEQQMISKYTDLFVVYPLATPLTIQLTPTQVKSLLGSNNIWADTGNILEGEYFKAL